MNKEIVIDGTGHVAGMLASKIAKALFEGKKITVLRTENIIFLGPLADHLQKYKEYKNKRCVVNPERGAFHYKEPSMYFKTKLLRGMMARKTKRGSKALANCKCYEGIPKEYENVERTIVPKALAKAVADPNMPRCTLGEVLSRYGWQYAELAVSTTAATLKREEEYKKTKQAEEEKINKTISEASFKSEVQKRLEQFA